MRLVIDVVEGFLKVAYAGGMRLSAPLCVSNCILKIKRLR